MQNVQQLDPRAPRANWREADLDACERCLKLPFDLKVRCRMIDSYEENKKHPTTNYSN